MTGRRGRLRPINRKLSRYDWAIVNAGPELAARAAVGSLLARGLIATTPDGAGLIPHRVKPVGNPIEQEILAAVSAIPPMDQLISEVRQGPAVAEARQTLMAEDLVLSTGRQRMHFARRCAPCLGFIIAAVLTAGHVDTVIACAVCAAFAGLFLIRRPSASPATKTGRRLLRDRQTRAREQERVGRLDSGTAVALFGVRSLWALNPGVAEQIAAPYADWASTDEAYPLGITGHASLGHRRWLGSADRQLNHAAAFGAASASPPPSAAEVAANR